MPDLRCAHWTFLSWVYWVVLDMYNTADKGVVLHIRPRSGGHPPGGHVLCHCSKTHAHEGEHLGVFMYRFSPFLRIAIQAAKAASVSTSSSCPRSMALPSPAVPIDWHVPPPLQISKRLLMC